MVQTVVGKLIQVSQRLRFPPREANLRFCIRFVSVFLCFSLLTYAQGNSFDRVRYNGGSDDAKVDPKEWKNKLTITAGSGIT